MTSAYAVSIVKRKCKLPCGHMGTLDPLASGVLPVGIDKTCRLFPYLLDKVKGYSAVFDFGYQTDTLDVTGKTIETCNNLPTIDQINKILPAFVGEIEQIPPNYSAKCINGKRGYQLARAGIDFQLPPKKIVIYSLKCTAQISDNQFAFDIECGGGTYIRSLCRDIGLAVGSLAVMSKLERTKSGVFDMSSGVSIEQIKNCDDISQLLVPADSVVSFPKIVLSERQATRILNGLFDNLGIADGLYRVYNQQEFWGIGQAVDGVLRVKAYVR